MVEGAKAQALELRLIDIATWERGISDLHATAKKDGTFNYTFFKAIGLKSVAIKQPNFNRVAAPLQQQR
jgi:hypothetical protein